MPKQFQEKLLNFLESGRISVDQMKRQYDFEIKSARYSQPPMNSVDYRSLYNRGLESSFCLGIPKLNSSVFLRKYYRNLVLVLVDLLVRKYGRTEVILGT